MEVLSPKAAMSESPEAAQLYSDAATKPLLVQTGAGGPTVACKGAILRYSERMKSLQLGSSICKKRIVKFEACVS